MRKIRFEKIVVSILILVLILIGVSMKKDRILDLLPESLANQGKIITANNYMVVDMKTGKKVLAKAEKEKIKPASLAKLFSLLLADKVMAPTDIVELKQENIDMVKSGCSMAYMKPGKYYAKNIYHAIIAPSGNDAIYALADHIGNKLDKNLSSSEDKVREYRKFLMNHLEHNGIRNTKLVDVTGLSDDNISSLEDVNKVVQKLLKTEWFRELTQESVVSTKTPSGKNLNLLNTNKFLDKNSNFYNPKIKAVKTGSLQNYYNMVCLYENEKSTYLILTAGSASDNFRYWDTLEVIRKIDEL